MPRRSRSRPRPAHVASRSARPRPDAGARAALARISSWSSPRSSPCADSSAAWRDARASELRPGVGQGSLQPRDLGGALLELGVQRRHALLEQQLGQRPGATGVHRGVGSIGEAGRVAEAGRVGQAGRVGLGRRRRHVGRPGAGLAERGRRRRAVAGMRSVSKATGQRHRHHRGPHPQRGLALVARLRPRRDAERRLPGSGRAAGSRRAPAVKRWRRPGHLDDEQRLGAARPRRRPASVRSAAIRSRRDRRRVQSTRSMATGMSAEAESVIPGRAALRSVGASSRACFRRAHEKSLPKAPQTYVLLM